MRCSRRWASSSSQPHAETGVGEPARVPLALAQLDDKAILAACRAAAHSHGQPVLGSADITARGVRIRLSSWPRQQEALTALRTLGYAAGDDSGLPGTEHGEVLLVTGWDEQILAARVDRLERAVRELETEHDGSPPTPWTGTPLHGRGGSGRGGGEASDDPPAAGWPAGMKRFGALEVVVVEAVDSVEPLRCTALRAGTHSSSGLRPSEWPSRRRRR